MDRRRVAKMMGSPAATWLATVMVGIVLMAGAPSPAVAQSLSLQVDTPAVTLTPTLADYAQDYVESTGASGIQLRVRTSFLYRVSILVRCADVSPRIALNDLLVRTPTAAGPGGSALSSYTALQPTNLSLWSGYRNLVQLQPVSTDIRIRNLGFYDDSPFPGTTTYVNTLVFTVVSP
jgi:hypothetical protein